MIVDLDTRIAERQRRKRRDQALDAMLVEAAEEALAGFASCPTCHGTGVVFECEHWPRCGCPGGTMQDGCPGRSKPCPDCPPAISAAGDLFHHPLRG